MYAKCSVCHAVSYVCDCSIIEKDHVKTGDGELTQNVLDLEMELSATKLALIEAEGKIKELEGLLKWQTGRPPKNGWYWIDPCDSNYSKRIFYIQVKDWNPQSPDKWAGPIEPPQEG